MPPGTCGDTNGMEVTPELLWALADECTRRAVQYLLETDDDRVALEKLSDHVAEEHSGSFSRDPEKAQIHLYHASLPKLEDYGVIGYDQDAGVVSNMAGGRLPESLQNHIQTLDNP